jgi:hypothetical protein
LSSDGSILNAASACLPACENAYVDFISLFTSCPDIPASAITDRLDVETWYGIAARQCVGATALPPSSTITPTFTQPAQTSTRSTRSTSGGSTPTGTTTTSSPAVTTAKNNAWDENKSLFALFIFTILSSVL